MKNDVSTERPVRLGARQARRQFVSAALVLIGIAGVTTGCGSGKGSSVIPGAPLGVSATPAATPTPQATPTPSPTSSPVTAKYTAVLLTQSGFPDTTGYGISGTSQIGYGNAAGATNNHQHALLWNANGTGVVDLSPAGFDESVARAVSGNSQVGEGALPAGASEPIGAVGDLHALLWSGTAASAVDLNPAGYSSSTAYGVSGATQVGYGESAAVTNLRSTTHALLWNGTAASVVDLQPATGFKSSYAVAVSGTSVAGYGYPTEGGINEHALLWNGTAASVLDINPTGLAGSRALAVSGGSQVGWGYVNGNQHAMLWNGSAASAVDLHPTGYVSTEANGVAGGFQVGDGIRSGSNYYHALVWSGTAASVVDLHEAVLALKQNGNLINPNTSTATGVDSNGNIVGYISGGNNSYAVVWIKNQ